MSINVSKSEIARNILEKKVLFIGLDGASKRIIDRMISRQELPTLGKLISTGSYFRSSHSFKPCASPVIWTSMSTGKSPDKHGVKGFFDNTHVLQAKRIWEIFDDLGLPVGVMGHFLTWPPRRVKDGFVIPNILALGSECYPEKYRFLWELTHDTDNEKKISVKRILKYMGECYRNGIRLSTFAEVLFGFIRKKLSVMENLDRFSSLSSISMRTKFYRDLFINLYREYRPYYAYYHIHFLDTYSHHYWHYLEPELYENVPDDKLRRYGNKVYNAYRNADCMIHDILEETDEAPLVVIASDHGFRGIEKGSHWYNRMTLKAEMLMNLDETNNLHVSNIIPTVHVRVRNATAERNKYYRELLENMEIVEDSKPLFSVMEIEPGDFLLEFNREIDSVEGKHVSVKGKSCLAEDMLMDVRDYTAGIHDETDGILILNGPGVRAAGYLRETVHVYDIVPTLFALCNVPVGNDMDGRVITAAIEEHFLREHPVRYIESYEGSDEQKRHDGGKDINEDEARHLNEQLRSLGYL